MHSSPVNRQTPSGGSFSSRYWHNQSSRNKVILASTAIVAATTLAYYWGYQDVDKRNMERERTAANMSSVNTAEKRR